MSRDPSRERFDALYREHGGRVVLLLVRLTGSKEDGEDLAQETFVRAWKSWPSFRAESQPSTWLHTVAVRMFADWCRSRARRAREVSDDVAAAYHEAAHTLLPDGDSELEDAIARLPPQMRHAVVLHYLEGLPLDQIATHLGKSVGTIKAQLHAARRQLRESLRP
jgi:RNA polymerase sigma-70 factor (ECF subfamily)